MSHIERLKRATNLNEAIETAVSFISEKLGVDRKEVALLLLDESGMFLKFYHPPELVDAGAIPLKASDAVAVKVLLSDHPVIFNEFQNVRHLSIFEKVKRPEGEKPLPIQKLMAIPLYVGNKPIGVLEVSRMGETLEAAGPDFTKQDLEAISGFAKLLAQVLARFLEGEQ